MKCSIPLAMMLVASAASGILAQKINADEIKWTNQRINDNKGEAGATPAPTCRRSNPPRLRHAAHPGGAAEGYGAGKSRQIIWRRASNAAS